MIQADVPCLVTHGAAEGNACLMIWLVCLGAYYNPKDVFGQFEKSLQAIHPLGRHTLEDWRVDVYQVDEGAHRIQSKRLILSRQAIENDRLAAEASKVFLHLLSDAGTVKASSA